MARRKRKAKGGGDDVERLAGQCRQLATRLREWLDAPGQLRAKDKTFLHLFADRLDDLANDVTSAYHRGTPSQVRDRAMWAGLALAGLSAGGSTVSAAKDIRDWDDHSAVVADYCLPPEVITIAAEAFGTVNVVINLPDDALRPPREGVTGEGRATEAPDIAGAQGDVGTGQGASVSIGVNAGLASGSGTAHDPSVQAVDLEIDDIGGTPEPPAQEPADPIGLTDTVEVKHEIGEVAGDEGATSSEDHPTTGLLSGGGSITAQQVPLDAATLNLEGGDVEARTDGPPEEGG